MNPLPDEIWNRGLSYADYRAGITRNQDAFDEVWSEPAYRPEDLEVFRQLPPLRVLAIGEDWCPDVYHTLPTWARLAAELPRLGSPRLCPRSEPRRHGALPLEGRPRPAHPGYAFYDQAGWLQAWWSGRGGASERRLQELLAGRTYAQLDSDEQKRLGQTFTAEYRTEFRRRNLEEILEQLRAFYHLG